MEWHHSVDVLVMGSGGAGQCAAVRAHDLGLEVLDRREKGDTWGGSTAMSAGSVAAEQPGHEETRPRGLRGRGVKYLAHLTGGTIPEERLRTFIP
jgi:succinate dehydrogenase/fumarate reductase flavoprotein subunit